MNESNISLIAQLRECEDADNGPVLIKLYFFPPPCCVAPSSDLFENAIFF